MLVLWGVLKGVKERGSVRRRGRGVMPVAVILYPVMRGEELCLGPETSGQKLGDGC